MRLSQKNDPMAKFGLNAEHLTSGKTRAADSLDCTLVGGWFTGPGWAVCVVDTLGDRLAYIGAGQTMKILNVNDSANPIVLGEVLLPCPLIFDIFVKDTLAYVANYKDGLRVINVSDPSSPFEIGFLDIFDWAYGVWVKDTFAYVVSGDSGLSIINVKNPSSMSEIGNCNTPERAYDVWVQDTLAYVADNGYSNYGLRIINVADPALPVEIGLYDSLSFSAVYVRDTLAYTAAGTGLNVINVAEPSSPVKVGSYDLVDNHIYDVRDIWVKDTLAYLAVSSGFSGVDSFRLEIVNIANLDSIAEVGFCFTPGGAVAVQVKDNLAYVEYCRGPGELEGLIIIDASNPSIPFETGRYGMGGINVGICIRDTLAYVTNHSRGLRIFNIADPISPREIGFCDTPGSAYDVYVQDTLAYVTAMGSGLQIINVANPYLPGEIGFWDTPPTYGPSGVWVQDSFAYVADGDSGLFIIDVSDPSLPVETGSYAQLGHVWGVWVQDTLAYVADGDSGLSIINVSDPSSPTETGSSPGSFSNLYINDTLAYVTGSKLHIFDISDPSSPVEISSCNTRGDPYGVWYKDNLVYVADGDSGLSIINVSDSSPSVVGFYNVYWEVFARDVCVKDSLIYVPYDRLGLYILKYTGPHGGIEELQTEKTTFNISSISNNIEINYSVIGEKEKVKIEIFNILGQKVACPVDGVQTRGSYTLNWNGKTGIYFVRMEIGGKTYKQKALLLRQ